MTNSFRAKVVRKATKECMHPADRAYETEDDYHSYVLVTEVDDQERFVEIRDTPDGEFRVGMMAQAKDFYDEEPEQYFKDWPVPVGGGPRSGMIIHSFNNVELFAPRYRIAAVDPWADKKPVLAGFHEAMVQETDDILEGFGAKRGG